MVRPRDVQESLIIIWNEKEKKNDAVEEIKKVLSEELSVLPPHRYQCGHRHGTSVNGCPAEKGEDIFEYLVKENLVKVNDGRVEFTEKGQEQASHLTRRHRLAERLLNDVLEVRGDEMHKAACEFEHSISEEVEGSICTFLGHPQVCPHGSKIPRGACCRGALKEVKSIIVPLVELGPGEEAQVVYINAPEHSVIHKMLAMGITPGTRIKLHQKSPVLIVIIGNATLAIEEGLAEKVFVRRK
ncbi:MAG: metal-dependent transcriptional regulator [Elusimicrobia bacterium]|nr:metal-dependent transcriptional regulator [Elusimicrobiota bacterium]